MESTEIKDCKSCVYFKSVNGDHSERYCHFLLDTGSSRPKDDEGNCLAHTQKGKRRRSFAGGKYGRDKVIR